METIEHSYKRILEEINTLSDNKANLLAVSKKQSIEKILELYELGQRDFSENYVQELVEKAQILKEKGHLSIRWHFIGHLQRNKVKVLLPWVSSIHSLDSLRLAEEISKQWVGLNQEIAFPVFIQVNIDEEESKSGLYPKEVFSLAQKLSEFSALDLKGLMCIPSTENADMRVPFRKLKQLELDCRPYTKGMLSMGMSSDYPVALEEGATHIRVGTALFGTRL
jgi:PLP dependent protein